VDPAGQKPVVPRGRRKKRDRAGGGKKEADLWKKGGKTKVGGGESCPSVDENAPGRKQWEITTDHKKGDIRKPVGGRGEKAETG